VVGVDLSQISSSKRIAMVAMFPVIELGIAIGLAKSRTRMVAAILAIGLHLVLIVILGPTGLNHRPSVLIWNGQFVGQAFLLFLIVPVKNQENSTYKPDAQARDKPDAQARGHARKIRETCGAFFIAVACLMPLTERFGMWDHWPSWALYAPHSSRVRIEVASSSVPRLPVRLQSLMPSWDSQTNDVIEWVIVPIDKWSLHVLDTPIYPQARYQLGVAKQVASMIDSEHEVQISILGAASRWTGQRQMKTMDSAGQLKGAGLGYWLNTQPRTLANARDF
jgi:hypothetical protein